MFSVLIYQVLVHIGKSFLEHDPNLSTLHDSCAPSFQNLCTEGEYLSEHSLTFLEFQLDIVQFG